MFDYKLKRQIRELKAELLAKEAASRLLQERFDSLLKTYIGEIVSDCWISQRQADEILKNLHGRSIDEQLYTLKKISDNNFGISKTLN